MLRIEDNLKGKNLVGVIPLAGWKDKLDMPWPDYLQPLAKGSMPIEKSVYECAIVGCDSIWVVCNDDVAPMVRHRLGDYVLDPEIFARWQFVKNKEDHKRFIPIFYVSIGQKDRARRDSLGWSILEGSLSAFLAANNISKWSRPSKYFVSFPYGLYNPLALRESRKTIKDSSNLLVSYNNQTVKNNKYLPFTFRPDQWVEFKRVIKNSCTGGDKNLPPQERWSSRNLTLDKIFTNDIIVEENILEIDEYYDLESWENLRNYYRSTLTIEKPPKSLIKPYVF